MKVTYEKGLAMGVFALTRLQVLHGLCTVLLGKVLDK